MAGRLGSAGEQIILKFETTAPSTSSLPTCTIAITVDDVFSCFIPLVIIPCLLFCSLLLLCNCSEPPSARCVSSIPPSPSILPKVLGNREELPGPVFRIAIGVAHHIACALCDCVRPAFVPSPVVVHRNTRFELNFGICPYIEEASRGAGTLPALSLLGAFDSAKLGRLDGQMPKPSPQTAPTGA